MNRQILFLVSLVTVIAFAGIFWPRHRRPNPPTPAAPRGVDPRTLLFSLPTLCAELPPVTDTPPDKTRFAYHLPEDNWRQVEFIANGDRASVERELGELARFKAAHRAGAGWKEVYVRKTRPDALAQLGISYSEVARLAGVAASPTDLFLAAGTKVSEVRGGFAIRLSAATVLYGHQAGDVLRSLNLDTTGAETDAAVVKAVSAELARRYNLFLVDWYQGVILP